MWYLITKLAWYLLIAFVIGGVVGWFSRKQATAPNR